MATENGILKYLDMEERMEIAKSCNITTRQQVYLVATGKSKNMTLYRKLVEKAEQNRQLLDRALKLTAA